MNTLSNEKNGLKAVANICVKNKSSNRAKILEYEELAKTLPQIEIPVDHYIHGGMYGREITIPKGAVITGQIYKFDHLDIMISGDITVSTDSGETKRLTGHNVFNGMSGKKRAGYAHEDTTWITIHAVGGTDGDEIQSYITSETFGALEDFHNEINRADYFNFVDNSLMTQEEIIKQVENEDDMVSDELEGVFIAPSKIQGRGLFSSEQFLAGDFICQARAQDMRTLAGRFSNHAVFPNAKIEITECGAQFFAIRNIESDEEITVNYADVIKNRHINGDFSCQE